MTETNKRFIRTIAGVIYDSENDSFIHQDYVGKPIEYEDECIKLLNELHEENIILKSELSFSQNQNRELRKVLEDNRSMVEVVEENQLLKKEIERLKGRYFQ